uniref:Organic solute transporter subunit alpha-like n=1 Tax=Saccoglossus kowalevskii TaxID=10224 RepID=A0ABM0GK16_SACKO|nr:PREDICTED: organic solute transporter subunit alpha-like [Saccoglossus kowalevskii]
MANTTIGSATTTLAQPSISSSQEIYNYTRDVSDNKTMEMSDAFFCGEEDPFSKDFLEGLAGWKIAFLVIITLLTVITVALFVEAVRFIQTEIPTKRRRAHVTCVLGVYPVFSVTSLLAVWVPRAHFIASIHASLYFSITLYRFVLLIFDYFGGFEAATLLLAEEEVKISNPPLLCCIPCLPKVKTTATFLLRMKRLAMQVAFIRPLTLFVAAVLWTDGHYTPGKVASNEAYIYLNTISIISTMLAIYALQNIYQAAREPLRGFRIVPKFLDVIYNILMIVEMFILCIAARFFFRTKLGNMRHLISRPSIALEPTTGNNVQMPPEQQEMIRKKSAAGEHDVDVQNANYNTVYDQKAMMFKYALRTTDVVSV